MSAIEDLAKSLHDYPESKVRLLVVDFHEPGSVINKGEICSFQIRVVNNGYLDMTNVQLHVNSANTYTQLSQTDILGNPINFQNSLTTASMNIPARSSGNTRTLYLMALKSTSKRQLFEAHLAEWNAGLSSLLRIHAGHDNGANVQYEREIMAA